MEPLTPNQVLLRQRGYTGDFGSGQGAAAIASGQYGTFDPAGSQRVGAGVTPVLAEPLNPWEKQALTGYAQPQQLSGGMMPLALDAAKDMLSNPQAYASRFINPMATDYMGKAGEYTGQGGAPITFQDVQNAANPYSDALKARLNESGAEARAALSSALAARGGRSFGDTSTGVRQGMIDKELLSKASDIDYNTFEAAKQFLQGERNRSLSAGGQYGNLAAGAQGITESGFGVGRQGLQGALVTGSQARENALSNLANKLMAGSYVRDYNQGINNQIQQNLLASQADEPARIAQVMEFIKQYQSNGGTTGGGANTLQTLGGVGQLLGGGINAYNQQYENLPWKQI